jgi:hypothetical protein
MWSVKLRKLPQTSRGNFSWRGTLEPKLANRKMYLYMHKSQMQLIPQLEQVLRDMKNDGTFALIEEAAFE